MSFKKMTEEERLNKYPIRRFDCANCKKEVIADSTFKLDKRTRFCCAKCEKDYWRKVTRHPTHLSNLYKYQAFGDVNKFDE